MSDASHKISQGSHFCRLDEVCLSPSQFVVELFPLCNISDDALIADWFTPRIADEFGCDQDKYLGPVFLFKPLLKFLDKALLFDLPLHPPTVFRIYVKVTGDVNIQKFLFALITEHFDSGLIHVQKPAFYCRDVDSVF